MQPVNASQQPQRAFDAAVRHYQAGQLAQAEAACRSILAAAADHADTLHLLGAIARHRGDHRAAVDLIGRAISATREKPVADFHASIALAHHALGQLDPAIDHFRQVAALMPDFPDSHFNLGILLRDGKRLDEAVAAFQRTIALKPDHLPAHIGLAQVFVSLERPEMALPHFQLIARLEPNSADAHSNLGNALLGLGKLDEAVVAYRRSIALKPGEAKPYGMLGDIFNRQGRADDSVACYQKALSLKPDLVAAHNNLGNIFVNQGHPDQGKVCFERGLSFQPNNAALHYNLANAHRDLGDVDGAIAEYQRAVAIWPDYAEAHRNLGNLLNGLGRLDEAAESFQQVLVLQPSTVEAHIDLGTTLLDQGQRDKAVAVANATESLDVSLPQQNYLLGIFLARCGLSDRAVRRLNASLAGDPEDRYGAGLALAALGAAPMPVSASAAHLDQIYADRARSWDRTVTGKWPYRGAELVARTLKDVSGGSGKLEILDAGCGTGLVGALVRDQASRLDGVDLSAEMIDQAANKALYDHLHRGDIVAYMNENPGRYDAIACAATLIHFGDLQPAFDAAANALRDGGVFVLTLFPNDSESDGAGVTIASFDGLAQGGCYAHGRKYVARAGEAAAFDVVSLKTEIHEYLRGKPRNGLVVALRRRTRA